MLHYLYAEVRGKTDGYGLVFFNVTYPVYHQDEDNAAHSKFMVVLSM